MSIHTEQDIEDRVERMMDHLDRVFLRGAISERQYTQAVAELNKWAESKYAEVYKKDNAIVGVFA